MPNNPQSNDDPITSLETLDKDDVVELLGEEEQEETIDITPPKPKEGEEGEEKEEEKDELKEIEEELEEPKEEDLELTTPVRRKEILAKYPSLFKDFPYLEKAYYREQQFTEVFPTIQDAKTAGEKAQVLDAFETQVVGQGDIGIVLQAAKDEGQEIINRIADNYLGALRKVDQQAYYHVLGNVIKDTIITMVREARNMGETGQPIQAAANILNQFVFGSNTFQPPTTLSRQPRPEDVGREQEFRYREQALVGQQLEATRSDLQTKADNVLKATIDGHIDPKGTMTDYVKQHASDEAFGALNELMDKDGRFHGLLDKLWEKAFERGFDRESTDRIKAAYLSKAKTLLPSVIKKARNDALRGLGRRAGNEEEREESASKKGPITPGKSTSNPSGKIRKASDIPKGMKTIDFLMQD